MCNSAATNFLNHTTSDLASQDNVYKPIEFEVKTSSTLPAAVSVNNFTTEVNKSEQDHDEYSSAAGDLRTPSKKIIPAIGDYTTSFYNHELAE